MSKSKWCFVGCLVAALLVLGAWEAPNAEAWGEPQGEWVPTENYLECNLSSDLSECAEWIVRGFAIKSCCLSPSASLSDENACDNPQSARGPGNGSGGIDL